MATLSPPPSPPAKNSRAAVRVPSIPRLWILLFLAALFPSSAVSVAAADISYANHCGSIVPESSPEKLVDFAGALRLSNRIFTGGGQEMFGDDRDAPFPGPRSFFFRAKSTRFPDVLRVGGTQIIRGSWYHVIRRNLTEGRSLLHRVRPRFPRIFAPKGRVSIDLHGFWSEDMGKLCMVGAGHGLSREGKLLSITAIFKLNYPKISNISSSLVSGTLESLDADNSSNHFDPISVIAYAQNKYEFTQISPAQKSCSMVNDQEESLGFDSGFICPNLRSYLRRPFKLEYGSQCSSGRCVPSTKSSGFSLKFMSLNRIHCLDDGKLHMYVGFSKEQDSLLVPEKTLVGEGVWDRKRRRLCLVACRIVSSSNSLAVNLSVNDCTIRMSFWFPAVWSIESRNTIVGRMWSDQNENASGYFDTIFFRNSENDWPTLPVPGLKYNYTKIDVASKSCVKGSLWNLGRKKYPVLKSFEDFRFYISVRNAEGKHTRGFATPVSIGETFDDGDTHIMAAGNPKPLPAVKETNHSLQNVSYKINFVSSNSSSNMSMPTEISAEGVYDAQTGSFCMVGCRYMGSLVVGKQENIGVLVECGILISIQLAPLNPKDGDHLSGTIRSARDKSDPLFFEPLEILPVGMDRNQAIGSIWRRKIEITMVLISLTLSCIFIGLQLLHLVKNPEVLPTISIAMLVILTLGYVFPLVLNFEALFMSRNRQNVISWRGGWLEVNEVMLRVITMVAFLLQLRFLQVAWTARSADEGKRGLWFAERKALQICLPLYLAGGLIAWFIRMNNSQTLHRLPLLTTANHHSFWEILVSYAGLILDGFLLPQVIFNIFSSSKDKALAPSFYVGTTAIRALPHVYDAYRGSHYVPLLNSSYIYASPIEDFYSLAWDIIIPCTGVLFSGFIYLQQRFGGTFFLPGKNKSGGYETVPAVTS